MQRWRDEVAPHLDDEWLAAAGRWSTRIVATASELAEIDAAIEAVLTPYVQRSGRPDQAPPGARGVRVLRHTLPEGPGA